MAVTPPKVVFIGSGPVASKSLEMLGQAFHIEAIITKPTTSQQMSYAYPGCPVFTVEDRTQLDKLVAAQRFQSPCAVLVDFGILVSQRTIDSFRLGIINSHFSLLPQWRGADPITFAILSGQRTTGVSLMKLVEAMDEGPLLAQAAYDIDADATTPSLTHDLILVSDRLLKATLPEYLNGKLQPRPQAESTLLIDKTPSYSHRLRKADGIIDWSKPAEQLEREIRAYLNWPKSSTIIGGIDLIITSARISQGSGEPGTILYKRKQLVIACGKDAMEIIKLKPAGKPEMPADAFLAGYGHLLGRRSS